MDIQWWKPQPKAPGSDLRAWSLLLPALASSVGFLCFAVLAFSFTEMAVLGQAFRTFLVVAGAISLAIGGELGTPATAIEVYRKWRLAATNRWDWLALIVSLVATLCEFILAFAALLGVSARWSSLVREYGPIGLGLLSAMDAYGTFIEYGFYLASYDERMESWLRGYERFMRGEYFATKAPPAPIQEEPEPVISEPEPLSCPTCGATASTSGNPFMSQNQLNAHMRVHARTNGHKVEAQ